MRFLCQAAMTKRSWSRSVGRLIRLAHQVVGPGGGRSAAMAGYPPSRGRQVTERRRSGKSNWTAPDRRSGKWLCSPRVCRFTYRGGSEPRTALIPNDDAVS
jgi:hypothetical protein